MEGTAQEKDLGGIELAEEVTGYSRPSIYRMVGEGTLPFFKPRRKLYFSRKELEKWIKSGRQVKAA